MTASANGAARRPARVGVSVGVGVGVGVGVVLVDQGTKVLARRLVMGPFTPVRNPDLSLGIAHASLLPTIVVMSAGIALISLLLVGSPRLPHVPRWSTALLLGGSVSNLIDRLVGGAVRDVIATPWVVLNVADVAVVVGVAGCLAIRKHPVNGREGVIA